MSIGVPTGMEPRCLREDIAVLTAAMYTLSRYGRSDGASICAALISKIRSEEGKEP